ncbi:DNA cytosine methyltransferase [Virgibacillus profundi]|nr:DNA cytosine methyltransferase [Virgibacillus profundi]
MRILSLFDGISVAQVALEKAGITYNEYFASEINKDSITVTKDNYPNTVHIGDVTKIDKSIISNLGKIDLLVGGSPCQGISRSKNGRLNLDDPRSKLFFEYVRIRDWIIKNNNPDVKFLLENVKPNKETLEIMNEHMGCEATEIDSVLVSAQRRKRLYWTNIYFGDLPEDKGIKIKDIVYDNTYKVFQDERIENTKTFTKNYVKWDISGKGYGSQQDRAYYLDGTMCTIPKQQTESKTSIYLGGDKYRRSHPIEIERMQNLPDNYTSIIKSPNKRMGLCGDGWTADVVAHMFKGLKVK